MNRSKLIQTLEIVSRGLERNNVLPIYENFCFTGETVFSFNDAFGVVALCKVEKPFGVHGPTFLNLLKASKSDKVEMEVKNNQLLIQADKSEYNLPIKTADEFVWQEPTFKHKEYDVDVIKGIECCLATCSENLALEAFARVYIGHSEGKISIYSTDGDALTKYTTEIDGTSDVCLSKAFCDAVIKTGSGKLVVGDEWVCSLFEDYKVYGRNLGATTFDYETNMAKIIGDTSSGLITIPPKFNDALTRARVVGDIETSPTTLYVENNELALLTETPFGEVFDSMKAKHPNIEVKVSSALLQTSMVGCTDIKVLKNCCIFKGKKIVRLVSNM